MEDKSIPMFSTDDYECSLSEELKETALQELREDPLLREQALAKMRHFIEKQQHIIKSRMDSKFLLRFLRTKKFSIPMAEEALDKYASVHCGLPEIMQHFDPEDPALERLINIGSAFPLLKKTNQGQTVIFFRQGVIDPQLDRAEDIIRYWIMNLEILLEDESNQINGLLFVCDAENNTLAQVGMWGIPTLKKLVISWEKAMAFRNKGLYTVNAPHFVVTLIDVFKKLVSNKISERIKVYKNLSDLYKVVPRNIFPKEYGGEEFTVQDMLDDWKRVLASKRKYLLALDEAFIVDENKRPKERDPYGLKELQGSFRQLNVD